MTSRITGLLAAAALTAACGVAAAAQTPTSTSINGEIVGVSGYSLAFVPDGAARIEIDDREAIAAHRAYGVQPYNHVRVDGYYRNGRFMATAIRPWESREYAFRATVQSVDGDRVTVLRADTGTPLTIDDTPAIALHRAYGVRPGTHVLVEGKYGSDNLFRADRIAYAK